MWFLGYAINKGRVAKDIIVYFSTNNALYIFPSQKKQLLSCNVDYIMLDSAPLKEDELY